MSKGYTYTIRNKITRLDVGQILTSDDFPQIPRATVITVLNRIAQNQDIIVRVKKGIFSKSKITTFGIAAASPVEALSSEIKTNDNKCFGGVFLFNQLGLTTQVPSTIEVLNNKSSYKTCIGKTIVQYIKIRPKITTQTKIHITTLEVIKKIQRIPDGDMKNTVEWLKNRLKLMSESALKKLVTIARDYPPRVRAILGNLLLDINPNLSNRLKNSLKENSYYRVGSLTHHLVEPEKWRLKS